jgi:hypothetical protein
MSVSATAHLNFRGNAREALMFYHSVFGGQIMIATYADVGVPEDSPNAERAVFAPVGPDSADADHVAFGMVAPTRWSTWRPGRQAIQLPLSLRTSAGGSSTICDAAAPPPPARPLCWSPTTSCGGPQSRGRRDRSSRPVTPQRASPMGLLGTGTATRSASALMTLSGSGRRALVATAL